MLALELHSVKELSGQLLGRIHNGLNEAPLEVSDQRDSIGPPETVEAFTQLRHVTARLAEVDS